MDLRPGYKHTDLGVIPAEWHVRRLGELLNQPQTIRYGVVQPGSFDAQGCPLLRSQDYSRGWVAADSLFRVRAVIAEQYRNAKISSGDLIMTVVGAGTGQVEIAPDWLDGAVLSRSTARIAIDDSKAAPEFVRGFLVSPLGRKQVVGHTKEGAQPVVSCRDVAEFQVPYPPLPEQRKIAAVLKEVDALLGAVDRLIAKKRALKQAAMQQLLTGQTRLPGFRGEWRQTTLGELGECIIGLTYAPENVVEHGLLVLRSSNIQDGRLAFEDNVYVNLQVPERLVTRVGDIVICVRNGSRSLIGKCALIDDRSVGLTFGAFMSVFRTRHWRFVFHAFQSHGIQRQIRDNIGATINQITNKDMRAMRLALPSETEQDAIADVLSDMDAELDSLEQRRDKTRLLKQGMLQELLTGRTRLL